MMVAVVALPLLLVFLFAVIDLGRLAFLSAEINTAAHAVCRLVEERPQLAQQAKALRQAAREASPSLSTEDIDLLVFAQVGDQTEQAYEYRIHDSSSRGFARIPSQVKVRPLKVIIEIRTSYITEIGAALSLAQGMSDGEFFCQASAQGVIDETLKGGV